MSLTTPTPIKLNQSTNFDWGLDGRLRQDPSFIKTDEKQSRRIGNYQLSGFDPSTQDYSNTMDSRMHFQKVYPDQTHTVDDESALIHSELSNLRGPQQLFARPYAGFFCGPGMPSLNDKDTESSLLQGQLTNLREKPCQTCRGKTMYRYSYLPDYGNPQRVEVIIPPPPRQGGWYRNGNNTRDFVRRVDYKRRCDNQLNSQIIQNK